MNKQPHWFDHGLSLWLTFAMNRTFCPFLIRLTYPARSHTSFPFVSPLLTVCVAQNRFRISDHRNPSSQSLNVGTVKWTCDFTARTNHLKGGIEISPYFTRGERSAHACNQRDLKVNLLQFVRPNDYVVGKYKISFEMVLKMSGHVSTHFCSETQWTATIGSLLCTSMSPRQYDGTCIQLTQTQGPFT